MYIQLIHINVFGQIIDNSFPKLLSTKKPPFFFLFLGL